MINWQKNKNVGLVLGGGGARGFFHMGVITAIQDLEIKIKEISGTSIGAIIGLIYAANPEINFKKIMEELDFFELVRAMVMGTKNNKEIEKFLKKYIGVDSFEKLKIKIRINATDINNQKEIVFDEGNIYPGLIASMSIPGVFSPLKYKNNFLIDGGISNNIPITLIEKSKKIIVSDISGPIKKIDEKTLATDVLYTAFAVMQQSLAWEKAKNMKNKKIIRIKLDDEETFILDFRKKNYEYLFDLGYKTLMEVKNKL
ncbi:MAG: patatin-like phospholipase family protein [Candidatus Shapirobacteria bacterium]|nr:patatin-like phospholipase family protein [Candidatus Shapirobacteria bacterium]